jgi:hypothetical protein
MSVARGGLAWPRRDDHQQTHVGRSVIYRGGRQPREMSALAAIVGRMAVKARQPGRFALAGDAEITDPVTGRVLMLGDVVREPLTGGVHTLANREVIAADIIADKMRSGVKPTVKVALASGRWITATGQHPLLTPDGWRPIAEIEPGETIALAGRIPPPLLPVPLPAAEIDLLAVLLTEGGLYAALGSFHHREP